MAQDPQERLIEAGIALLERDGPQALQARRIASVAGTSTMAVYTNFGGMRGLLQAVAAEVFARFGETLTGAVPESDDPVADFFALGAAYRAYARANPQRYLLLFGAASPRATTVNLDDLAAKGEQVLPPSPSFHVLTHVIRRMMAAGRIREDNEMLVATRAWSLVHGSVTLELAGFFMPGDQGLTHVLFPLVADLLAGMGADRDGLSQSIHTVLGAPLPTAPQSPKNP